MVTPKIKLDIFTGYLILVKNYTRANIFTKGKILI